MVRLLARIRSISAADRAADSRSMPIRPAGLAVGLLDVLEDHDVLPLGQHVVEEAAQRAGLLGEGDQEVVPEPLVHHRALDDVGVAADVVVAAGDEAADPRARLEVDPVERGRRHRSGGLGDDAVGLVEREHLGADRAGRDGDDLVDQVAHDREGEPADRPTEAPSTNVSRSASGTGPPAASAAVMLAAPSGSTPTTRVSGQAGAARSPSRRAARRRRPG